MLPNLSTSGLQTSFKEATAPSLTWDFNGNLLDGIEAVRQSIYCILSTERFYWSIFSYDYGAELSELTGQPMDFVQAEAERLVKEALLQDDRITDITNFQFEPTAHSLAVYFNVSTIFGETLQEVTLGPI